MFMLFLHDALASLLSTCFTQADGASGFAHDKRPGLLARGVDFPHGGIRLLYVSGEASAVEQPARLAIGLQSRPKIPQ
jgi:hypothetical protein